MNLKEDINRFPSWTRAKQPEVLKFYQEETESGTYALNHYETWWKDRYYILESHGYRLRPRYHPDWTPSWAGTDIIPRYCEDSYSHLIKVVIDAVRVSDGTVVAIKQVPINTGETRIIELLSSPEMHKDTNDHCVPILDRFRDEAEPEREFIVMPLLRPFNDPPFYAVGEVIDFMEQTLVGLAFLHENNIAHRDCSDQNVMMEGSTLYPEGFHPSAQDLLPSAMGKAKPLKRIDVPSVKYYFVDFGLSRAFKNKDEPRLVRGRAGLDQDVPELKYHKAYDAFPVDVFILGNLYKRSFVDKYHNMQFIKPLTDAMTQQDPSLRPTSAEALERFRSIIARRNGLSKRWRLRDKNEFILMGFIRDINNTFHEVMYTGRSFTRKFIGGSPART